ncbi:MAG TPA: hypothetical protein VL243_12910 [Vicinamibacterales bacterium]|jgi:hypothetical protein|nr:hypothetical protein [Vicinamibacterales bacterium]
MSLTAESTKARIGYLAMFGGFLALVDSLWGALLILPFGFGNGIEIALGIGLVLGLPAYILDFRSRRRIVIFLPVLLLFRWILMSAVAVPHSLGQPWRWNVLLIAATVLLQWSNLRQQPRI